MIELKRLSPGDGRDVYELLQQIPPEENGFENSACGMNESQFKDWLLRQDRMARGEGIDPWMVPQTTYWLYADGVPVAIGKLRHRLTKRLQESGGHIGYAVRPGYRGLGYGKKLLAALLVEAAGLGIDRALLTVRQDNLPSVAVAKHNGGRIEKCENGRYWIWVACAGGEDG